MTPNWDVVWIVWLAFFAVFETWALVDRKRQDTFSEKFWKWSGHYNRHFIVRVVGRVFAMALGVWLAGHFAFEIWNLNLPG